MTLKHQHPTKTEIWSNLRIAPVDPILTYNQKVIARQENNYEPCSRCMDFGLVPHAAVIVKDYGDLRFHGCYPCPECT